MRPFLVALYVALLLRGSTSVPLSSNELSLNAADNDFQCLINDVLYNCPTTTLEGVYNNTIDPPANLTRNEFIELLRSCEGKYVANILSLSPEVNTNTDASSDVQTATSASNTNDRSGNRKPNTISNNRQTQVQRPNTTGNNRQTQIQGADNTDNNKQTLTQGPNTTAGNNKQAVAEDSNTTGNIRPQAQAFSPQADSSATPANSYGNQSQKTSPQVNDSGYTSSTDSTTDSSGQTQAQTTSSNTADAKYSGTSPSTDTSSFRTNTYSPDETSYTYTSSSKNYDDQGRVFPNAKVVRPFIINNHTSISENTTNDNSLVSAPVSLFNGGATSTPISSDITSAISPDVNALDSSRDNSAGTPIIDNTNDLGLGNVGSLSNLTAPATSVINAVNGLGTEVVRLNGLNNPNAIGSVINSLTGAADGSVNLVNGLQGSKPITATNVFNSSIVGSDIPDISRIISDSTKIASLPGLASVASTQNFIPNNALKSSTAGLSAISSVNNADNGLLSSITNPAAGVIGSSANIGGTLSDISSSTTSNSGGSLDSIANTSSIDQLIGVSSLDSSKLIPSTLDESNLGSNVVPFSCEIGGITYNNSIAELAELRSDSSPPANLRQELRQCIQAQTTANIIFEANAITNATFNGAV